MWLICTAALAVAKIGLPAALPTVTSSAIPYDESLSIKASIESVNNTHVVVSIPNAYSDKISILRPHSIFQHGAEHTSFRIAQSGQATQQTLDSGPDTMELILAGSRAGQFVNIDAGDTYIGYFELTAIFDVQKAGSYDVTVNFMTRAFLHSDNHAQDQSTESQSNSSRHLHSLHIKSDTVTVDLSPSGATLGQRQNGAGFPGDCFGGGSSNDPAFIVNEAKLAARNLAKWGQGSTNADLWNLYFNGNGSASGQQSTVSTVFQGVINYGMSTLSGTTYGAIEQCDPNNTDPECQADPYAAAYSAKTRDGRIVIVFCQPFFSLPANTTCQFPSYDNEDALDQGAAFLHEIAHVQALAGGPMVSDGVAANCYDFSCVVGASQGNNHEDPSWQIASNYHMYAMAARAIGTSSCNVDVAAVTKPVDNAGGIDPGSCPAEKCPTTPHANAGVPPAGDEGLLR